MPNDPLQSLSALMQKQFDLMRVIGVDVPKRGEYLSSPQFVSGVIGLSTEASEVLDAISIKFKPWKTVSEWKVEEAFKEELIDVLFMWLEVCIMARMKESEITELYNHKLGINLRRIILSEGSTENQKDAARALLAQYHMSLPDEGR